MGNPVKCDNLPQGQKERTKDKQRARPGLILDNREQTENEQQCEEDKQKVLRNQGKQRTKVLMGRRLKEKETRELIQHLGDR